MPLAMASSQRAFVPLAPLPFRTNGRRHYITPLHCCSASSTVSTTSTSSSPKKAIVIGAGVSGLTCARRLAEQGVHVVLLESSDEVGGRIRSDKVDGFILDRGFQVFIESYPLCRELLDYSSLDLQPFIPGAKIRYNGSFHTISDPFRAPLLALSGLFSPIGSLADKLRVLQLRFQLLSRDTEAILDEKGGDLRRFLQDFGFSTAFIDAFFRPFYQGIFLAPLEQQLSGMFQFVFKMFATGNASLPRNGIGAIPKQLYDTLPHGTDVRFGSAVEALDGTKVQVAGEWMGADAVVVATEGPEARRLLGKQAGVGLEQSRGCCCVYFEAGSSPLDMGILALNGDKGGLVNNMFVASDVARSYAPEGRCLVSVTVVGLACELEEEELERRCRTEMRQWFGRQVDDWRVIRTYRIAHAQSGQEEEGDWRRTTKVEGREGVFVCGDHRNSPTVHGALQAGLDAAGEVVRYLKVTA